MTPRLARRLTRLYPAGWRARYGAEFATFLEERPSTTGAILDVVFSALRERAANGGGFTVNTRQRSLTLMAWAYLAAVAAGVNFYWIIDDTPVIAAMGGHAAFALSHALVAWGSFAAFAAVVAIALPVVIGMLRSAFAERRGDVIARVAVPFGAAAVTLTWLTAAALWGHWRWGGGWVATPWDVNAGDQPAGWPPVSVRTALASVTALLLVGGLLASAVSVAQAIQRSDLSRHPRVWFKTTAATLAGSVVLMTLGMGAWGWLAEEYAPAAFHARDGLLIDIPMAGAWLASTIVFLLSSVTAVAASRASLRDA